MSKRKNRDKPAARAVQDSFSNPLFQLGRGSQSPLEATEYPLTRLTDNYALMNSLYRDNWLVQNVVELIPEECLKKGFELTGSLTPAQRQEFYRLLRKTALSERLREGLCWGRLYGGAVGLILIKGQHDRLSEPLDLAAVLPGSFEGLYILDRWTGVTPELGTTLEAGRPTPEYYSIDSQAGLPVARVHHSRLVRFTGRELPALERYAELFWGASEVESLYKEVVAHDNVSANMAGLTFRANINTMEVANLEQLFGLGSAEAQRRFWQTMQAQTILRSNFGTQLVNKGDRIENTQYTFTGLKDVFDSMCLNLCGCSHIPAAKLFGREPAGLNASGKSDLQNYYDYVEVQREAKLRPVLEKLLPVLAMSCWGFVPEDIGVSFPPLWTPTAKELAEIVEKKATVIRDCFQAGLLAADTAQRELKKLATETGIFDSITDEEINANAGKSWQELNTLRDPLLGLVDYHAEAALQQQGICAFVDKAGRRWSLHAYCSMAMRTTRRQAEIAAVLTADPEQDLYKISSHSTACPLCAQYEGWVYSRSGLAPDFPPLSAAFGKVDPNGPEDLSNSWLNIHPNCLHVLLPWT